MRISDWSSDVCSSDLKSASAPLPPTSSNLKVKPPAMPSSAIAGGLRAKTMASLIDVKKPIAFPTKASELFSSPERCSHGLSIVNIIPFAWPWPKKLKPRTTNTLVTMRSEEHTSELQSLMRISYAAFCLKKKTNKQRLNYAQQTLNHS